MLLPTTLIQVNAVLIYLLKNVDLLNCTELFRWSITQYRTVYHEANQIT